MKFLPKQFFTRSLHNLPQSGEICQVLATAMNSADAENAVRKHLSLIHNHLVVEQVSYDLSDFRRIFVLAFGKAALPMAKAVTEILSDLITSGVVITKDGYIHPALTPLNDKLEVIQAGHPIPDHRNISASQKFLPIIQDLHRDDLVICLISGGGSSLLVKPSKGISLKDIQDTTGLLLNSGATINEMNIVRKHLDDFKGGNLAKRCFPASVICLILSDVIGDKIDMIASGPTVADPSTYKDAWAIIEQHQLSTMIPQAIRTHLEYGVRGVIPETVKPSDPSLKNVQNCVIGNNVQAVDAAVQASRGLGFHSQVLTTSLNGEASQVGRSMASRARELFFSASIPKPFCLIAGGETTVTVHGSGVGGRNQELVLGAVQALSGIDQLILISLATDGGDGPTDAAGAVATNWTYSLGLSMGLDPNEYLQRNDSYHYFEQLGDLIKTGPTLTNVNDLLFVFGL